MRAPATSTPDPRDLRPHPLHLRHLRPRLRRRLRLRRSQIRRIHHPPQRSLNSPPHPHIPRHPTPSRIQPLEQLLIHPQVDLTHGANVTPRYRRTPEKRPQRVNERDSYLKRARPRKGGARGARPRPAASPDPRRSQARAASICATARPQTRIPMGNRTYRSHTHAAVLTPFPGLRWANLRRPRETRFVPRLCSGLSSVARVRALAALSSGGCGFRWRRCLNGAHPRGRGRAAR
jgi:hypothetical protein